MIVSPTIVLIDPTADLQAAIDNAPDGSTLRLAPGIYTAPDAGGFTITKPITIEGSGKPYVFENISPKTPWDYGTIIRPYNATSDTDGAMDSVVFVIGGATAGSSLHGVTIRNLGIENPYTIPSSPVTAGTGDGIRINCADRYVSGVRIEDVSILFMGRNGIRAAGASLSTECLDQSTISRVQIAGSRDCGIFFDFAVDVAIDNVAVVGNEQPGIYIKRSSNIHVFHCLFNENNKSADTGGGWPYYHYGQLYVQSTSRFSIHACDFEVWNTAPVPHCIALEGAQAGSIMNNASFNSTYPAPGLESVFLLMASDCLAVMVASNQVSACTWACYLLSQLGNRGNVILPFAVTGGINSPCAVSVANDLDTDVSGTPSGGNFCIMPMTDGSGMETSGAFSHEFSAGVQIPVVSATAVITSTVMRGTMIWDDALKKLRVWDGSTWQTIGP